MRRFLLMLLASTVIATTPAYAVTHINTGGSSILVFDDEEEFVGHLINQAINDTLAKFKPKTSFGLEYKELLFESQMIFKVGYPNMDFTFQAPIEVLNNKFTGILFSAEWRF